MYRKTSFFHRGILEVRRTVLPILILFVAQLSSAQIIPLRNAHSHNDYRQKHPLEDALKNRFVSVEADVFLIKGELFVSHTYPFFKRQTLEELYLEPLQKIWLERNHTIYGDEPLILLIDVKSDAEKTYPVLKALLQKYREMLSSWEENWMQQRSVSIVITGNSSRTMVESDKEHFIFLDQSLISIKTIALPGTGLMASTKYSNITSWKGKGQMPEKEKEKLKDLVRAAHFQGKTVRLWASPENIFVWNELLNCGVDLINTDELEKLNTFLSNRR